MTPSEFRHVRQHLGLSTAALARVLRYGRHGGRCLRYYEAGARPIPGPVIVAMRYLARHGLDYQAHLDLAPARTTVTPPPAAAPL